MQTKYTVALLMAIMFIAVSWTKKSNAGGHTLKVMTYNTHHCSPPGKSAVIDVDAIASVIKKENPDIVAVQEIDVNTKRDGHLNEATEIASKAGYKSYYFAKTIDFEGGEYGILILSKYPLSNTVTYKLPTNEAIGGEHRVLATATVQLPNKEIIQFGCTHLDAYHVENRLLQIKEISRITAGVKVPFIIAGDFNAEEGSDVINILDQNFTRTCTHCAPTIHEDGAGDVAIDFIAYKPSGNFIVQSHYVLQDIHASDHYPVVSVMKLNF